MAEIITIIVVALFVIGPKQIPEALRVIALTLGRIRQLLNSTREELERQIDSDDIRQQLHNENIMGFLLKKRNIDNRNETLTSNSSKEESNKNNSNDNSQL